MPFVDDLDSPGVLLCYIVGGRLYEQPTRRLVSARKIAGNPINKPAFVVVVRKVCLRPTIARPDRVLRDSAR